MTGLNTDGLVISHQDLSTLSPSTNDDGRIFRHDGSSEIGLSDGTTSVEKGYYRWDSSQSSWIPLTATLASVNGNRVYSQSSKPSSPSSGDVWIDTS